MHEVWVADIGGTHCRIAKVAIEGPSIHLGPVTVLPTPRDSLPELLASVAGTPMGRVAIAAAGHVEQDAGGAWVQLTNTGLLIREADLRRHCRDGAALVNDLVAAAAGLGRLESHDSTHLCGPEATPASRGVAVLGVGTGLGAAVVTEAGEWIATEAGHVDLAPVSDDERHVLRQIGEGRVSAEYLLSGPGLLRLHRAACGAMCSSVGELLEAARGGDASCRHTLQLFSGWLGRVAGNLVLTTGAWRGIYLVGGVVTGLGEGLDANAFARGFVDKAPFSERLASVPVRRIRHPQPALIGLAEISLKSFLTTSCN